MTTEPSKVNNKRKKDVINIIRTTQRNNIELTHIADNKANVLLSLNALMITLMLPLVLANIDLILSENLGWPLLILSLTNLSTIYISTIVLMPGNFRKIKSVDESKGNDFSPFFFGNYYKLTREDFIPYMNKALDSDHNVRQFLADDLYYIGKRLGEKMQLIKWAFFIFLIGFSISILATIIILMI